MTSPSLADINAGTALQSRVTPGLRWNARKGFLDNDGTVVHQLETRIGNSHRKADGNFIGFLLRNAAFLLQAASEKLSETSHDPGKVS